MKHLCARHQSGYLLMVAIVLIVVVGFIGSLLAYMHSGSSRAMSNTFQSNSAFNIALSGLEKAKRDIIVGGVACNSLNYTKVPLFTGQYSVTGSANTATTTTAGYISSNSTDVPLHSVAGLGVAGRVAIGSEKINYGRISGNTLKSIKRGVDGTTATAHTSGSSVSQNQCTLIAIGAVPTVDNPIGKRTLRQVLATMNFGIGGVWSNYVTPAVVGLQTVNIPGNATVSNPSVSSSSPSFAGSTVIAGTNIVFNGSGSTRVSDLNPASSKKKWSGDAMENQSSVINSSNLFGYYFNGATKAAIYALADKSYNSSNINGVTGKLIWMNDLSLSGNVVIGSASAPVILIVSGNINLVGTINIYGLVYVMNGFATSSGGNVTLHGALAAEGAINLNGSCLIEYDPVVLGLLNYITRHYGTPPVLSQEVFD